MPRPISTVHITPDFEKAYLRLPKHIQNLTFQPSRIASTTASDILIARRAEAAERRIVEERAVADQRHDLPFRLCQLDPQRKTQPLSETPLAGEQALWLVP